MEKKMNTLINDKRGATLEGWVITIVLCMALVIIFNSVIMSDINEKSGGNSSIAGLPTDAYQSSFQTYQSNVKNSTTGGEKSFSALGLLILGTAWDTIISTFSLLFEFIGGSWMNNLFSSVGIPNQIRGLITGLLIISISFLILKIVFKMKV